MRYGEPSVARTIEQLQREGVRRLLVLPLYPQYSATSTGSVIDAVADTFKRLRWPPELRIINDYHDDPGHIDALAASIEAWWAANGRGDRLLLSFHGIPERYVQLGDPYFDQCQGTARLLRERLRLGEDELLVSFQSRVGRERWLHPYTDATRAPARRRRREETGRRLPRFRGGLPGDAGGDRDAESRFLHRRRRRRRCATSPRSTTAPNRSAASPPWCCEHVRGWPESTG